MVAGIVESCFFLLIKIYQINTEVSRSFENVERNDG